MLFTPDTQTGAPGDTLNYTAVFQNTSDQELFTSNATFTALEPAFFDTMGSYGLYNGFNYTGGFVLGGHQTLQVDDVVSIVLGSDVTPGNYTIDAVFSGYAESDGDPLEAEHYLGTGRLTAAVRR